MTSSPFMDYMLSLRKQNDVALYGHELTDGERKAAEKQDAERRSAEEAARKQAADAEWKARQLAQFPPRYAKSSFDNFIAGTDAQKDAVAFLKTGKSAVLYGGNGTGKTHLAFAAMRKQIEAMVSARYVVALDFFALVRRSFRDDSTENVVRGFADAGYLVVDEVDKGFGSQTEFVYLYQLVNERYNRMLPTVLVTNAREDELASVIGASTLSRVAGEGAIINLSGPDYRQRKTA